MTAKQFAEWEHYARLEPFDETRQDYRIASIVQMIANVNRDTKQRKHPYTLEDFRIRFDHVEKKKEQTWAEKEQILHLWAASFRQEKESKKLP